jgi:transposase-like protein
VKKEAHDYNIVLTMTVDKSANYRAAPLRLDSDGELHCNYLNNVLDVDGYPAKNLTFILQHQKAVVNNLKITEGCRKTNDYYKWVMAYHNWFCTGYDELRQFIIPEDVCTMEVV